MRALVGDTWVDGLLDPHRGDGDLLIDVRAWAMLRRVDGLYFVAESDWRRVLRYAAEFGIRRVVDKMRSRLAERGRNDKFLSVGIGIVTASDAGSAFPPGDAVCFVAPAHPRGADRICLAEALVRPARPGLDTAAFPAGELAWRDASATEAHPTWDALAGWSACSGLPLDAAQFNAALEAALPSLAATGWSRTPSVRAPVQDRAPSQRGSSPARPGALRAAVFGLGHYAKTNLIPNLPAGIEVTEIREIDPLQMGPMADATRRWAVSTDPELAAGAGFDIVCAAGFHHSHAPLATKALTSGAWALVEKPIATTQPQLDALLEALAAHPGRLFACFHKRFDPLNAWALADLKEGARAGEPIHYQALVFEVPLPQRHWYRWPNSGSRIVSNGCHWIDHFLFLNDWSSPKSHSATRASNGDITCLAQLENGASMTLVLTDHGSARLGVRDHVELRAGETTVVIDDGSSYRAERTSGVVRSARLSRRDTYARMYREIGARILGGGSGDSIESVERSAGLMLKLEAAMRASSTLPFCGFMFLALMLGGCGGTAPSPAPPSGTSQTAAALPTPDLGKPPDLLLISVDTLRADHLGCYGDAEAVTPFIDSLAREGVRFAEAMSAVPITLPSHATMFTGLYPSHHGARDNTGFTVKDDIVTLAETLREAGYQTGAFIGALPLARVGGLAQGFDVYDDAMPERVLGGGGASGGSAGIVPRREERTADEVIAAAKSWLATTDAARPSFGFIHLFDPHSPYEKSLPGTTQPSYDGEVAFVDRSLAAFLPTLRRDPRWRNLVVMLVADHGEGLGEHGEATHCIFLYQSTLHVPMIVHAPGRFAPRVVEEVVGLVDVTPTLEAIVGLAPLPQGVDGRSLLPALRGEKLAPRDQVVESLFGYLNFGWAPLRGLRSGPLKLIDAPRPELFDLARDPHEATNLHATRATDASELGSRLSALERGATERSTQEDRDRMEGLAALGYVSARPAAGANSGSAARPDPKDRIADYDAFQQAHVDFAQGRAPQALATMLSLEPRMSQSPYFYLELGNFAGEVGDLDQAARAYAKCLLLEPGNTDARLNSGVIRLQKDDPRGALAEFEALLKREPNHAEAHLYAGVVLGQRLGDEKAAIARWRRFVELAPAHPEAAKIRAFLERHPGE